MPLSEPSVVDVLIQTITVVLEVGSDYLARTSLELAKIHPSVSQVLDLKVCVTIPHIYLYGFFVFVF